MRGRPRKPEKVKKMQGTARKCRQNPDAPEQSENLPVPPAFLGDLQRKYFDVLSQRLDEMGYRSDSYNEAMAIAADLLAKVEICDQLIKEKGLIYATSNAFGDSVLKEYPFVKIQLSAYTLLKNYLVEMGLTPAAISRVTVNTKKAEKKSKWTL